MNRDALTGTLARNLLRVRDLIALAAARSGRSPADVRLVAVAKSVSPHVIRELMTLGLREFGENRPQQLAARAAELGAARNALDDPTGDLPRWHLIGHLQRNKVRRLLNDCRIVHSLDSLRLAQTLDSAGQETGACVDALLEVNVSGEASKGGVQPDEAPYLLDAASRMPHLLVRGLMTMAPAHADPQLARPHFAALRELLASLHRSGAAAAPCRHLSMGMSGDYAVAIEEGATLVRVGTALFEGLPQE